MLSNHENYDGFVSATRPIHWFERSKAEILEPTASIIRHFVCAEVKKTQRQTKTCWQSRDQDKHDCHRCILLRFYGNDQYSTISDL